VRLRNRQSREPIASQPQREAAACDLHARAVRASNTPAGDPGPENPVLQKQNPQNRDLIVNINGRLVHRDQAGISPFDSAVQAGDAVWEGLRLYDGRIFRLTEHLDRLRASAQALAFDAIPSHAEISDEIRKTLAANAMRDNVHIRLTLSRGVKYTSGMDPRLNTAGPTLIVLAEHKPPVYGSGSIALITSAVRRFAPDMLDPRIHHCNLIQSILAKIQANHAGADDALMLDARGFIAETNATHVFLVVRDVAAAFAAGGDVGSAVVQTPFCHACPEGITRAAVLQLCRENAIPACERDLSLSQAYRADEVFCTGTMGELVSVSRIDGRRIGDGNAGPVTRRLIELFRELTAREGTPVNDE
jgi:branched-chain amino acid aminotransferase